MPTRKIADLPYRKICRNPSHDPPNMIVLPPGIYEHECPGCGHKQTFVVPEKPWCEAGRRGEDRPPTERRPKSWERFPPKPRPPRIKLRWHAGGRDTVSWPADCPVRGIP